MSLGASQRPPAMPGAPSRPQRLGRASPSPVLSLSLTLYLTLTLILSPTLSLSLTLSLTLTLILSPTPSLPLSPPPPSAPTRSLTLTRYSRP